MLFELFYCTDFNNNNNRNQGKNSRNLFGFVIFNHSHYTNIDFHNEVIAAFGKKQSIT